MKLKGLVKKRMWVGPGQFLCKKFEIVFRYVVFHDEIAVQRILIFSPHEPGSHFESHFNVVVSENKIYSHYLFVQHFVNSGFI